MTNEQKNHARMIFNVEMDENRIPKRIFWTTNEGGQLNSAAAMVVNLWDAKEKNSLKMDLWVKDLPVNEMTQFFYQSLMSLSETFERATGNDFIVAKMKTVCKEISDKIGESKETEN